MKRTPGRTSDGSQCLQKAIGQTRASMEEAAAMVTTTVGQRQSKGEKSQEKFGQLLCRFAPPAPVCFGKESALATNCISRKGAN